MTPTPTDRTRPTPDCLITVAFNAFSAAAYCRKLKADNRDIEREADALRTELQSLADQIK